MSILRQDSVLKTRLQDLRKNSSWNSNDMVPMLKTTTILFIPLMFARRVWGRYKVFMAWDGQSAGVSCLLNILEFKNKFQQLAVLICFPEMPSELQVSFLAHSRYIYCWITSSARVITMGSTGNSRLGNFARTSISFVCYDRGIFEYFARQ